MEYSLQTAIELQRKGDLNGAAHVLTSLIKSSTQPAVVHHFLGLIFDALGQGTKALKQVEIAKKLEPENAEYWYSFGNIISKSGNKESALEAYQRSIEINPKHLQALVNAALNLQNLERYSESFEYCKKAVECGPEEKKAWLVYLGTLAHLRNFDEAERRIIEVDERFPNDEDVLLMWGNLLCAKGDPHAGYEHYKKALQIQPNHIKLLNSIGNYLSHYKDGIQALPYHKKALTLNPKSAEALHGIGTSYLKMGAPGDAIPHLVKAIELGLQNSDVYDALILSAMYLDNIQEEEIFEIHQKWEQQHAQIHYPSKQPCVTQELINGHKRIKFGFVSADFRDHSVCRFMTCLMRHLNNHDVDVYYYSDIKQSNNFTKPLEILGGNWVYTITKPDDELAACIRKDQIDVLFDLSGHTGLNRLMVFARKPAPIQISWLGYPNTTGLKTMDYRFSDDVADPPGRTDLLSSEKIIRLPHGFHCFEPPIDLPSVSLTPALANGYLTFGSFNNQSKISSLTVARWSMLLKAIPDSRLILKNSQLGNEQIQAHWKQVFSIQGINPKRVEYMGFCSDLTDHYQTYQRVDIALDTFPYNGTTTTCEALWMGVPVLTISGDSQRSRTGASLMTNTGLTDWIAASEKDWLEKAVYWNHYREELNEVRLGLRQLVSQSSLGDGQAFAEKFVNEVRNIVYPQAEKR